MTDNINLMSRPGEPVHFWSQGPLDVIKLDEPVEKNGITYTHKFYWHLLRVKDVDYDVAKRSIRDILRSSYGWARAGVMYLHTKDPEKANILVEVVPAAETACGANSAGCYAWNMDSPKPVASMDPRYFHEHHFWRVLVNMEIGGHGTFRMWDMYMPNHQPYTHGVMGTADVADRNHGWPSAGEIDAAKKWLAGQASNVHRH